MCPVELQEGSGSTSAGDVGRGIGELNRDEGALAFPNFASESFRLSESGLTAVEGEERVGAENDGDCHVQDIERAIAELCRVCPGTTACHIPGGRRDGHDVEDAALDVDFKVMQRLPNVEATCLAPEDSKLESVRRLKHDGGTHEDRRLNRACDGHCALRIGVREIQRDNKAGICADSQKRSRSSASSSALLGSKI